ncbi:MAG TPA: helix-turn-helix domain-containing protein [Firmicutes bacterium]|nr:helix-turn-helix domain-containing protein [Candidatus Fermentithermobacillaceae bacterium]
MDELLTTEEVANILKVSPRTILRWIHAGTLAAVKLGEGRRSEWRIRRQDLNEYIEARLKPAERKNES